MKSRKAQKMLDALRTLLMLKEGKPSLSFGIPPGKNDTMLSTLFTTEVLKVRST
jgi:hypothetical protein